MTEYFEIIPGESIGPFKLGMTREEIEELDIHPRIDLNKECTYYPLADIDVEEIKSRTTYFPSPGVEVYYDTSGTCHLLKALFQYWPYPPVFTLCGHVTNGMSGSKVKSILRSIASDVKHSYGSIYSLSAGIRATKWEAGDEPIMCITVMPKEETTSHAG
jgi:hypothetical protein